MSSAFQFLLAIQVLMVDSHLVDLGNGVSLHRSHSLLRIQFDPRELDLLPANLDIFCTQIEGRLTFNQSHAIDTYTYPIAHDFQVEPGDHLFCSSKATSLSPVRSQYFETLIPAVDREEILTDDLVKTALMLKRGKGVMAVSSIRPWNPQLPSGEVKLGLKFGTADPTVYRFRLGKASENFVRSEKYLDDSDSRKVVKLIRKTSCERVRICAQLRIGLTSLREVCQSSESRERE